MTTKQQEQYERMLAVARRDALTVVARGTRKRDGATVYAVPSRTQANTWHLVVVEGANLVCTCQAAKHGRYCCHRAAVRARIILAGQLRREAKEREIERAFHAAARALNMNLAAVSPALTPSPKLADDQAPVSIFR